MLEIQCSQGHINPSSNRFCHLCGERLPEINQDIQPGLLLGNRYRIDRELGRGGFGRTYLAQDANRFNELCVLKEFAPQVQGSQALQKAQELFEREAGVLYSLQHSQIPRFREMFRASVTDRDRLFLVQDYVNGQTYRHLLSARRRQGAHFSELEVSQLLVQLLPVLDYIHRVGVIHRDISPDNIILRYADQLPVLIDFGGVKQAAAKATEYVQIGGVASVPTRLGKLGYAPVEQLNEGQVAPHSDLYALAMTAVVLLIGKEPQEFLLNRDWQRQIPVSPGLQAVLDRMLAPRPHDRYQSANEALIALGGTPANASEATPPPPALPYQPPTSNTQATLAVGNPRIAPEPIANVAPAPAVRSSSRNPLPMILLVLVLAVSSAAGGWWVAKRFLLPVDPGDSNSSETESPDDSDPLDSSLSPAEQSRKDELRSRREALGVSSDFLIRLTDERFYEEYPDQQGRSLDPTSDADAEWRSRWDTLAMEWLDTLDAHLSATARSRLGSYTADDQDSWKDQLNQLYVGSRSLNDLTDAKFFSLFPDRTGTNFIDQPIGQIWRGMALDQVEALANGNALAEIKFERGESSVQVGDRIGAGDGRVYIAYLIEGQILRLNLQAPDEAQLSLYLPRPTAETPSLLEDSDNFTWSGRLPQSGYYEIVVVSNSGDAIDYELDVSVDTVRREQTEAPSEAPVEK